MEIGSDIGGSIRNPSHFCGVFGHKPTFGIVPLLGHIPPPPGTFPGKYTSIIDIAVAGPMARSAKDLDLVMSLITSPGGPQSKAWKIELPGPRKRELKDYKIGLWLDDASFPTDAGVLDCLQNAVDTLSKSGARIEEKRPDIDFAQSYELYFQLLDAATSAVLPQEIFNGLMQAAEGLPEDDHSEVASSLRGATMLHRTWMFQDLSRTKLRETWAEFFEEFDILLCPTVSITAFPHDHTKDVFARRLSVNGESRPYFATTIAWAGLTGMAYLPSTIAPVGLAQNGLPVGMQIVAPYLEDRISIQFAGIIENILGGFVPPPGLE